MTIREVANEAHVSTTTITRFCRKLNCDGFSEFKVRYKLETEKNKNHHKRYDFSIILDFLQRANTEVFQNKLDEMLVAHKEYLPQFKEKIEFLIATEKI